MALMHLPAKNQRIALHGEKCSKCAFEGAEMRFGLSLDFKACAKVTCPQCGACAWIVSVHPIAISMPHDQVSELFGNYSREVLKRYRDGLVAEPAELHGPCPQGA